MIIGDLLILANIGMGLLLGVLELNCWRTSCDPIRWMRLFRAVIGFYWAGIYLVVLIKGDALNMDTVQILVRPAITVTLAAMASWAIIQAKPK